MVLLRNALGLALFVASAACGPPPPPAGPPGPAPTGSAEPQGSPPSGEDAFAVSGELDREKLPPAMPDVPLVERPPIQTPPGVPPAPTECGAFVRRKASAPATCTSEVEAREALAAAIAIGAPDARDTALVALESCATLPGGFARALRMELAPVACADVLGEPFLASPASARP